MYREVAQAVYRRGETHYAGYQLPGWGWGLIVLDLIIFLPVIIMVRIQLKTRSGAALHVNKENFELIHFHRLVTR